MKGKAILFPVVLLFLVSCGTKWNAFNANNPENLIELLVEKTREYNPPGAVLAYEKLKTMGAPAFPSLVQHARDKRLAWGCFQLSRSNRTTVGETCVSLLQIQLQPCQLSKDQPEFVTERNVDEWWLRSNGKSIQDLQTEALDWTIAEIEKHDGYKHLRERGLSELRKKREELNAGRPLP